MKASYEDKLWGTDFSIFGNIAKIILCTSVEFYSNWLHFINIFWIPVLKAKVYYINVIKSSISNKFKNNIEKITNNPITDFFVMIRKVFL